MCFSAGASFGAGTVLSVIGVAAIKKSSSSSQLFFAVIPLLFAAQQITEGFLWLSLTKPAFASLHVPTTYIFLFFAQVVWPVWVPFAISRLKAKALRKTPEKILITIGALVSLYLAYCLIRFPVDSKILGLHISYSQDYPRFLLKYFGFLYIAATILPPFLSRIRYMWLLGIAIIISYIITAIFYTDYIVSVWCFFASIISITVYVILRTLNRSVLSEIK